MSRPTRPRPSCGQATNDIIATINQFSAKVNEAHDLQYALEQQNTNYFA